MKRFHSVLATAVASVACGWMPAALNAATDLTEHAAHHATEQARQGAPLLAGLGTHSYPITTNSPEAQRYFNQGLILCYAFNHDEAIRSFTEAARIDPNCAMAYWGIALAHGPNINRPMSDEAVPEAWAALQQAIRLAGTASEKEQAYIQALTKRYAQEPVKDRSKLDLAYADAMREVAKRYPDDVDVATLFAESLMDTMPWDYWTKEGQPKPATVEVLAMLEGVLTRNPDHPGANHYYIHAVEASPNPERGLASAHRLGDIVPDAGHLVHMPAHIYLRLGMYHDASLANERAIRADNSYASQCAAQGYYPKLYVPHNIHFLWYSTTMEGRSENALKAARQTSEYVGQKHGCAVEATAQAPLPLLTLARFGRWDELLKEPRPEGQNLYSTAMWHYTRGLAHAATGQLPQATEEKANLEKIIQSKEAQSLDEPFFPGTKVLAVANHVLAGEIAARQGRLDEAINQLKSAARVEDELPYMEPPYWYSPVRQTLGAILLQAGRPAEAETAYREDLQRHPENGWSLYGLMASLRAQGKSQEAADVQRRFNRAWAHADVTLTSTRF